MKGKHIAAAAVLACLTFGCSRAPAEIAPPSPLPEPGEPRLEAPLLSHEYEARLEMPPAVVIVEETAAPAFTEEELEALAIIIYQEAGGDACSDETRSMVGTVVMNRVESDLFPDTIQEVATQKRQYGRLYWTGLVWPERASNPGEAHAVQRAYDCARAILEGERALPADVIWQAEFPQGTEIVAHQDGLYFCR